MAYKPNIRAFRAAWTLAAVWAPGVAAPAAEPYPSVEHATFHQLVFANDDVAILNNLYPPQGNSGFHVHPRDLFFVAVTPSLNSTQRPGQPVTMPSLQPAGLVGFNLIGAESFVHRVINNADQPARFIAIEIRRPAPSGTLPSARGDGYVQIIDNHRLRAWRVVLEPGQSAAALTQRANGVRVVVRGGVLRTQRPGIADQTLALEPGDFAFQNAGETRAMHNAGKTAIELVEIELK